MHFFLKVKPRIQLRNTREVSTRGGNGLRSSEIVSLSLGI